MDQKDHNYQNDNALGGSKHQAIPKEDPPPYSPREGETPFSPTPTDAGAPQEQPGLLYRDRFITCDSQILTIRAYYFPWGTKSIPLPTIQRVERVPLGILSGRGRIWGTANAGLWAHLDPARPSKNEALVLDIEGANVQPLITPDNLPALAEILVRYTGLQVVEGASHFL